MHCRIKVALPHPSELACFEPRPGHSSRLAAMLRGPSGSLSGSEDSVGDAASKEAGVQSCQLCREAQHQSVLDKIDAVRLQLCWASLCNNTLQQHHADRQSSLAVLNAGGPRRLTLLESLRCSSAVAGDLALGSAASLDGPLPDVSVLTEAIEGASSRPPLMLQNKLPRWNEGDHVSAVGRLKASHTACAVCLHASGLSCLAIHGPCPD